MTLNYKETIISEFLNKYFPGFQEPASPIAEGIINFHNYIFFFLVIISFFVFSVFFQILVYFWFLYEKPKNLSNLGFRRVVFSNVTVIHGTALEVIWTIIPAVILIFIAIPSFSLLYSMDEAITPGLTIKVIGHQWYWSYEYSDMFNELFTFIETDTKKDLKFEEDLMKDAEKSVKLLNTMNKRLDVSNETVITAEQFEDVKKEMKKSSLITAQTVKIFSENNKLFSDLNLDFDSYMVPTAELVKGDFRLLEVSKSLVLPYNTHIRLLVSSADVLHSFSVNSLGIKVDAVPGRLNQLNAFINRPGVFYGQCSELCGVNHGMMPIVVRAVTTCQFFDYMNSFVEKK